MKKLFLFLLTIQLLAFSHPSYTGYSSAPGSKGTCALSCHGSGTGSITLSGVPTAYEPGKAYTITVKHSSGSTIVNFNFSTRKGTTSTIAGSFSAGTSTATYSVSGTENGIRASTNYIDSANFLWTAPAAGTGEVKFFLAGLQGSKSGQNTKLVVTVSEKIVALANEPGGLPGQFELFQNYPNPFNPVTTIDYQIPNSGNVSLKVYDMLGDEVATLVKEYKQMGKYAVTFDGSHLASGSYIVRIQMEKYNKLMKMMLVK